MRINKWHYLLLIVILLPILAYWSILIHFALDLPKGDDYGDSLQTMINLKHADSINEKWQILFKQHNEHRILFNRLTYLFSLQYFSKLNYTFLIFLGNFSLIVLAITLLKSLKNETSNYLFAIPIVYLIFQPSAYDSMFWAITALSNYYVMLWAALCCFFLCKHSNTGFSVSLIFATLAVFTLANGLLILPLGAVYLLYSALKNTNAHAKWQFIIWLSYSAVVATGFLWDYQIRDLNKLPVDGTGAETMFRAGISLFAIAHWFFALLGSAVSFGNANVAALVGLGATTLACLLTIKGLFKTQPAIFNYLAFVFASIMMAAVGRSTFIDIQWSQSPRYTFYSSQAIALLASVSVLQLSRSKHISRTGHTLLCVIIAASIIIGASSYAINIEKIKKQQFRVLSGMWIWNTKRKEGLLAPFVTHPGAVLQQAEDLKLYHPPAISYLPAQHWRRFRTPKNKH